MTINEDVLLKIVGVMGTIIGTWLCFYIKKLSDAVDKLVDTVGALQQHIAENYVSKDDCKDVRANCPGKVKALQ